ncbi:sigma-70 family RNA polymerase sigma factor [Oceanospirillum sediminis]|uniref:RNA polymerase sigma factor n=1 Tax=Oceanospirillum sediminis TaxID=2760088 RepID=A0A839IR75_9GAMM|nr:sigma-70 family RNA polymerase sigma factor [Oceanospirillum sediminis]MBB1486716.1 sigma-70 family RNA polymerase sigma factor [Oceanospirillum sediminis]
MEKVKSVSANWNQVLTEIARHQDRQQFARLYEYFAPRVKTYLLRFTASEAQAEELAQEALLQVWRKASKYHADKAAASTWIFCIARNLFIDQQRSGKGQLEQRTDSYHEHEQLLNDRAQEVDYDHRASVRTLDQAIKELPIMQAQLVYKSYFEGKSHSEIAGDLDIPIGSVKSGLRLAFKKLRAFTGVEDV